MKGPVLLLFLFLAITEELNKADAVSSNGIAKKKTEPTKTTTVKPTKTVPSTKPHVKISKSKEGPAKHKPLDKTSKHQTGKKITFNISDIKVDVPRGNSSTNSHNSTHGNASTVDDASKDYTVVGEYKIFKYEDDRIKQDDCPPYWHRYDKNCYLISRNRLDWYRASMQCFKLGGFLATVESSHENTYIINQLKAYKITRGAWMALNTVMYPNKHKWYWGFTGSQNYAFDWFDFEPVYKKKGDYSCAIFWKTYHFHWHVESCSQKNYYVCKIKLNESCTCTF